MDALQEQGRACFNRGDYRKALEYYDRAITRAPSAQLYDKRAECHEKLQDLHSALKEAKKTINSYRADATGYLRAGSVLKKMDRASVALEIYTHGLKSIKHRGQAYETLRKHQEDLQAMLSPPKSVDPLTVLPRELALSILEHLSFQQVMNASLVSKQWAQFIRSCPKLWSHLDLSRSRKKVRTAFISRAINVGREKLTAATLTNLYDFDKTLAALFKYCRLQDLILPDEGVTAASLVQILTTAKHLKNFRGKQWRMTATQCLEILQRRSEQIEHFECIITGTPHHHASQDVTYPLLHALSLRFLSLSLSNSAELFSSIRERMPLLTSLTIHADRGRDSTERFVNDVLDLKPCAHLLHLDLILPLQNGSQLTLPASLVRLRLSSTISTTSLAGWWDYRTDAGYLEPVQYYLPVLEELHLDIQLMQLGLALRVLEKMISNSESTTSESDDYAHMSRLRKLTVCGADVMDPLDYELLRHPRVVDIEELRLLRLWHARDEIAQEIVEALPKLQVLELSESDITGVAIRPIVKHGGIKDLIVNDCEKIGTDAIEFARAKGIRVQHRLSAGGKSGRKLWG